MNLTIIYGNGFDKNLGLNTTYPDFYKWLRENDEINPVKFEESYLTLVQLKL